MTFETDRLMIRRLTRDDLPRLAEIHADAEVTRYLGGVPWPAAKTERWLGHTIRFYERFDAGQLGLVRKSDGCLIGRCGPTPFHIGTSAAGEVFCFHASGMVPASLPTELTLELGYTLAREVWGHGYATEAGLVLRDHILGARGERRLIALIDPENRSSIAVARRLGFAQRCQARFIRLGADDLHEMDLRVLLFELGREEWVR